MNETDDALADDIKAALRQAFEDHPDFYSIFLAVLEDRGVTDEYRQISNSFKVE